MWKKRLWRTYVYLTAGIQGSITRTVEPVPPPYLLHVGQRPARSTVAGYQIIATLWLTREAPPDDQPENDAIEVVQTTFYDLAAWTVRVGAADVALGELLRGDALGLGDIVADFLSNVATETARSASGRTHERHLIEINPEYPVPDPHPVHLSFRARAVSAQTHSP